MRHPELVSGTYQLGRLSKRQPSPQSSPAGEEAKKGFTLAEVLITLVVIGVVAAITIPILRQSTGDKEYDAARKVALMTIGQAGRQMAMNGELNQAAGTTAEQFVKNHFSKYVKIAKECGTNLSDCGFNTETDAITQLDGDKTTMFSTLDIAVGYDQYGNTAHRNLIGYSFALTNGYAVNLFYNSQCTSDTNNSNDNASEYVCINAVYDMNGKSKPNKVGKDIGFVSVIYPDSQSVAVAPNPYKEDAADGNYITWNETQQACTTQNENLIVPNKDELLSMYYNNSLLGISSDYYWSSSEDSKVPINAWEQGFGDGYRHRYGKNGISCVRCVWR